MPALAPKGDLSSRAETLDSFHCTEAKSTSGLNYMYFCSAQLRRFYRFKSAIDSSTFAQVIAAEHLWQHGHTQIHTKALRSKV